MPPDGEALHVTVCPVVTVAAEGLQETISSGTPTATVALQVVVPAEFCTVKVHVCVAVGVNVFVPEACNVPLPRFPLHEYGILPSASPEEDQPIVVLAPRIMLAGEKETEHVGTGTETQLSPLWNNPEGQLHTLALSTSIRLPLLSASQRFGFVALHSFKLVPSEHFGVQLP